MEDLYFSQQHIYTQRLGSRLNIKDSPHYKFLEGEIEQYIAYLYHSWQYYFPNRSSESLEKMVLGRKESFLKLSEDIKENGIINPVEVFRGVDGKLLIYDGNHRASAALFHNKEIPMKVLELKDVVQRRIQVPEVFYGSKNNGLPYQSVYGPGGILILKGRRDDLLERNNLIYREDIKDNKVLDIGCNYGNALFLLKDAKTRIGIDKEPDILTAAVRLNVIFDEDVEFRIHDANLPLDKRTKVDTGFIFSVDAHLQTLDGLVSIIQNNIKNVVYFETHEGYKIPREITKCFSEIVLLGKLGRRKFYRCMK